MWVTYSKSVHNGEFARKPDQPYIQMEARGRAKIWGLIVFLHTIHSSYYYY
jgi:hypothetical protein